MPDIEITIADRKFFVACRAGEEHFLNSAAKILDSEATPLQAAMGRLPEARMLLMAGLMLADRTASVEDDLRQARARIAELEARAMTDRDVAVSETLAELPRGMSETLAELPRGVSETLAELPLAVSETLAELAVRAESLADKVEERLQ